VYTEDFLVVPARQIGIASPDGNRDLLKAIALYLNSDFVAYHQFLTTTQAGIQKSISTLRALRSLPLPFESPRELEAWVALYSRISLDIGGADDFNRPDLVGELNKLTFESLKLSARARAAVYDLVHVRSRLIQGKTEAASVGPPSREDLEAYAQMLRDELNAFVGHSTSSRHTVDVLFGSGSALIAVGFITGASNQQPVRIMEAGDAAAGQLAEARSRLLERRAQWLYFNRNLRVYDGPRTYILKPLQLLHWTRTQAIRDAGEIIADSLMPQAPRATEAVN